MLLMFKQFKADLQTTLKENEIKREWAKHTENQQKKQNLIVFANSSNAVTN